MSDRHVTGSNEDPSGRSVLSQYEILALTFNQDGTALAMGTLKDYSLFTIGHPNDIIDGHDCEIQPFVNIPYLPYEEVHIIERLFSSSLIALVSSKAPRTLKVCHFKKGSEICSYAFANTILAVKLNRMRLIVCLEDSIYVHNMRDMKILHTIQDVPSNRDGLCALSPNDTNPYLAYPGSTLTGEIQIFDTTNLRPSLIIHAHESPLAAMAFNKTGEMIATASNKGTVIRVHNILDGTRLFDFRRGVRRCATIYSLAFSPDSQFLAASGNTETIHIFRLLNQQDRPSEKPSSWMGSFSRLLTDVAYYLPGQTSEVFTQDRAFATIHSTSTGIKTNIAMNIIGSILKLYAAGHDGIVSVYEVDTKEGGECKKTGHHLLFNMSQSTTSQQILMNAHRRDSNNVASGQTCLSNTSNQDSRKFSCSSSFSNPPSGLDQRFSTAIDESKLPELPPLTNSNDE